MSFILLISFHHSFGEVRLPRLISDGMVLQRNASVKIWGWASIGEEVSVNFCNKNYRTITNKEGKWLISLQTSKEGGPYTMAIQGHNLLVIKDILIGEVWVCSGQSNMVLPMERVKEKYGDIIAQATNSAIRHFFIPTRYNFNQPQEDFTAGKWESATPENVLKFTATGYFFAKQLYEKYHVPIGLINASVGGSPVEAWLSEEGLKAFPAQQAIAEKFKDSSYINQIRRAENAINKEWYGHIWQQDKGMHDEKKWFDPNFDASSWATMKLPAFWHDAGLENTNGVVWFRKEIEVPASMAGKAVKLFLGRIVDSDSVYVNGKFVGTIGYQYPPRRYEIPANILREGKNTIVIRVINTSGKGGFIKDKPYQLKLGEEIIDLKGDWQYKLGTTAPPLPASTFFQYKPLGLYNGMIAPLINYTMKGVIWYQGEANADNPSNYKALFSAMIVDWRKQWGLGDFPFLYVQLANFMDTVEIPSESKWAELREAQLQTLATPKTGMAVIIDVGEWNDIHPLNKADVGNRLGLLAQKIAYGNKKIVSTGPVYESMQREGGKVILTFSNVGGGLVAKGNDGLKYFAIAGSDRKFVWAKAQVTGNKVIVWNETIKEPVAVRYAWADNPAGANLYNKEGLPASPFRTDTL